MTSRAVQQSQTLCPLQPAGDMEQCSSTIHTKLSSTNKPHTEVCFRKHWTTLREPRLLFSGSFPAEKALPRWWSVAKFETFRLWQSPSVKKRPVWHIRQRREPIYRKPRTTALSWGRVAQLLEVRRLPRRPLPRADALPARSKSGETSASFRPGLTVLCDRVAEWQVYGHKAESKPCRPLTSK